MSRARPARRTIAGVIPALRAWSAWKAALGREVPALLVTADRTPDVRAEAERDNILVQNKPVRPASMRAWLTQFSALQREAAE